jgi:large subunit ribosomal protein L7Ae
VCFFNRRKWGGGIMGIKTQHVLNKRAKALELEMAKKIGLNL